MCGATGAHNGPVALPAHKKMAVSMAEAHYNDTHSGIRDNNGRERNAKGNRHIEDATRIAKSGDAGINGSAKGDGRQDRWRRFTAKLDDAPSRRNGSSANAKNTTAG